MTRGAGRKLAANGLNPGGFVKRDGAGLELGGLGEKRGGGTARGEAHDFHAVGDVAGDLEGAFADGTGRTQDSESFHSSGANSNCICYGITQYGLQLLTFGRRFPFARPKPFRAPGRIASGVFIFRG